MDKELEELIERVRKYEMTEAEIAEQRVSYAYGNTLSNDGVSREEVRRVINKGPVESKR